MKSGLSFDRYLLLVTVAVLLVLLWILTTADPCMISFIRGRIDGSGNPIAITRCVLRGTAVIVTVGDFVIRQSVLFVLMGVFGFVSARLMPPQSPWSFAIVAAMGAILAFVSNVYAQVAWFPYLNPRLDAFIFLAWVIMAIVAALGARSGAGIAYRRMA